MSRKNPITRRRFIATTAGGIGGLTILPSARIATAAEANDRLRLAIFGTMYNAQHFLIASHIYNADIVAICEPDRRKMPGVQKKWADQADRMSALPDEQSKRIAARYLELAAGRNVETFDDIRQLYDKMSDRIDAIVVSQYDHLHGVACGPALRAGIPVCSERPLGLRISDARGLRQLATETGLPTTYRSPGTGTGQFRRAMELVEDGAIGDVNEVHIWFRRGGPDRAALPQTAEAVPDGLNWDGWLGPLPARDYNPDWMSYAHWRETCSGGLGTFGPHTSIFPFMTMQLRRLWDDPQARIRVRAECSRRNLISFPRWERVRWEIPARGDFPPLTITWHHGPEYAPGARELVHEKLRRFGIDTAEAADDLMRNAGSMLVGSEGALLANDHSAEITALPREKFETTETNQPQRIMQTHGIYRDWIDAIRGEKTQIIASFDNGGPLSELLMLGNIATQFPATEITYNPVEGKIVDFEEAESELGFSYRDGWEM